MSTILVGSAPDSWGVWFPDDPNQTPYTRFLDEVAASGYEWIELGPFGYLPTDPAQLSDELAARNLKLIPLSFLVRTTISSEAAITPLLLRVTSFGLLRLLMGSEAQKLKRTL